MAKNSANRPVAPTQLRRSPMSKLLASALAALSAVSSFATAVEFKLAADLKGREQRIAAQLAQSLGADEPAALGSGVFSINAADDAKAASLATALRERGTVLWAQSTATNPPLSRAAPETEFHGRMLALTLRNGADAAATVSAVARRTGQQLTLKRVTNGNRALVLLPQGTTPASLAAVAVAASAESSVRSAERIQVLRHQWIPNDTMWTQQWALGTGAGGIRVEKAWDATPSGSIAVAVIDTGIRSHRDLDDKRMAGYDMIRSEFISGDGNGRDPDATDTGDYDDGLECTSPYDFMSSWHGTHVAGIIAASTNNGEGMAGVAPNARIVPVRSLGRCGGTLEDVADSIRWAAGVPVAGVPRNPNPAKVLNLSLGGYGPCSANMQSAVDAAINRGSVVVVSAGNEASLVRDFTPANCRGVIAVAAGNLLGDLSSYSNFGTGVAITAPGGDSGDLPGVISTLNGGITQPGVPSYATYSGTSMAAPHVAGVVALMLTRDPTLSAGQVINRLLGASRSFVPGSDCASAPGACGAGLLDAANAVAAVTQTRLAGDLSGSADRVRLIEMREIFTGRYALTPDPVEALQMATGFREGLWARTGYTIDTFSFTAQFNSLAIAQPVCRSRLVAGGGFGYSASTEECQAYAANSGWAVDGMTFLASFPNGKVCPVGSAPVHEFVRVDGLGYNVRTLSDPLEISRMIDAGWVQSRIAFCVPK
jgi:subtilisin family serine protease